MFLAPFLLPLLALASVPIIIHLLNRRRFQRVDWAPMKYLKLTIKSNRRRLRLEQLLLLALRTAMILVLIFAIARPVLSSNGFASWLGGRTRTSRVIVIDDSLSMGYGADRHTAMDSVKEVAGEIVRKIGAQDSVTVITSSAPELPLVREAHLDDPSKLAADIAKLNVTETTSDWPATLRAVDGYLNGATFPVREVVIFTDLRKSGWGSNVTAITSKWAGQSVTVRLIDVGLKQTANVALIGFEQETPIALPGVEVKLRATIRNDDPSVIIGAQAVLKIGEDARTVVLPDLAPGATTEVPLSVTLPKAGQTVLQFSLPNDALPQDNFRWLSVNARPRLDLQLVDGEPNAQAFESATDFLALSFSIGSEPWQTARSNDSDWANIRPMVTPDVLTLANVASISPENVAAIEKRVREGMGLMLFCGDQLDATIYNQRLFRDGAGLLPGRLDRAVEGSVTGLVVEPLAQSPLSTLAKLAPAALARISARKFMAVSLPPNQSDNTRVLARWNDPEGHPAVIEKRFGKGRVILWAMSANKQWGDWPLDPTYVLAVRSAALTIARPDSTLDNVTAGQALRISLESGQSAVEAKVLAPGKEASEAATIDHPEASTTVLGFNHTARAGGYLMTWKDSTGREQSHSFAANPDKAESDLSPITDTELQSLFGPLLPQIIHYAATPGSLSGQGREIWRTLAMCLMGMMLVESVFAVWVGRER